MTIRRVRATFLRWWMSWPQPEPKSEAGYRTLILPSWCEQVLDHRYQGPGSNSNTLDLVFPSRVGTLRDPPNVDNMLKDAFMNAGFPDITSHIFRKTVATLMDQAGLSPRAGADQLGHSQVTMTMNTYWGRKAVDTRAAPYGLTISAGLSRRPSGTLTEARYPLIAFNVWAPSGLLASLGRDG